MQESPEATVNRLAKARRPIVMGLVAILVLVGGIGTWSVQSRIAGAVIASGLIQVENKQQVIQHPQGGVVGEILARDGDHVEAGDPVLRLDDTLLRSELAIITRQLNEIKARAARLEAERDTKGEVEFETALAESAASDPEVQDLIAGQVQLFEARKLALQQEAAQIDQQITQTGEQIVGVQAQLNSIERQTSLVADELVDLRSLLERGLAQASRVTALEREEARLLGEAGQLHAQTAQLETSIAELELQKLRQSTARREDAIAQLRDLSVREIELAAQELTTRDLLSKMEIRSPVTGVILGSQVFALQSVISPAAPIMYVVPLDQPLVVAARVEAIHINQVHVGQEAVLRFVAFNQRETPEIFGAVSKLSPDAFTDEVTGISYYKAELVPYAEELAKLEGQTLLPGMPVEAFIRSEDRSPLSFLTAPLAGYFYRAFREE
ncbi:MAG: HlyD family type I secretion periplasmic adaptor subunit [Dinoroseobacter sp.]|nr:HlyD family type I secretion periplasmic adaptor subunit [Dinoroseobacter sp.]